MKENSARKEDARLIGRRVGQAEKPGRLLDGELSAELRHVKMQG